MVSRASTAQSSPGSIIASGLALVKTMSGATCSIDADCGPNTSSSYLYYCAPNYQGVNICYQKLDNLKAITNGGNGVSLTLDSTANFVDSLATMGVTSIATVAVTDPTTGVTKNYPGCGVVQYANDRRYCVRVVSMPVS